jgi:peptide/nickel transport system substrate-binding protein
MFAPLMDLRTLNGMGPRLADHTMNAIPVYPFPAYEDIKLKNP